MNEETQPLNENTSNTQYDTESAAIQLNIPGNPEELPLTTRNSAHQWLLDINMFKCKQNFFILYMTIFEISFAYAFWLYFTSQQNFQYLLIWPAIDNIFNYIVLATMAVKHPRQDKSYTKLFYFEIPKSIAIGLGFYLAYTGQRAWWITIPASM